MKLLEKLRWLPTEMPWPGTAEVSAKSWLLPVLVGETPGISSARSRKLRPLSGRLRASVWNGTGDLAAGGFEQAGFIGDIHFGFGCSDGKGKREFVGGTGAEREGPGCVSEAGMADVDLIGAQFEVGEAEAAFAISEGFADEVRFGLARDDFGVFDDATGRVDDAPANAGQMNGFLGRGKTTTCQSHTGDS